MELMAVMTEPSSSLDCLPSILLKFPSEMDFVSFSISRRDRRIFWEMKCPIKSAESRIAQKETMSIFFETWMMSLTRFRSRCVMESENSFSFFPSALSRASSCSFRGLLFPASFTTSE